jgi:hypothetical protein
MIIVGFLLGTDLPLHHGLSPCVQVKQAPSTHPLLGLAIRSTITTANFPPGNSNSA